ncbi:MAG: immunoglobulin domain-containing protein [Verrucomicrobiota bacterium]
MKIPFVSLLSSLFLSTSLLAAPPANDNKASAITLSGDTDSSTVSNSEATQEPGDFAYRTLWWKWTAPANGQVVVDTVNSTSTYMALQVSLIEQGGQVTGIIALDSGASVPQATFPVVAGTSYMIGVGTPTTSASYIGQVRASVALNRSHVTGGLAFSNAVTMGNDSFASRKVLSGTTDNGMAYNTSATREPGEPAVTGERSFWWSYTPPVSGRLQITTANGGNFYKTLSVFLGPNVSGLKLISVTDANLPTLNLPVTAGTEYQICVASYNNNYSGSIVLGVALDTNSVITQMNIPVAASFANDSFDQRAVLSGSKPAGIGYNLSATTEPGEPASAGVRTLWWTYTAAANGRLSVSTEGSDSFYKNLAVYQGTSLGTLRLITVSTDNMPLLTLPVTAGSSYQICVGSYNNNYQGNVVLSTAMNTEGDVAALNLPAAGVTIPDHFSQRQPLSGSIVSAVGYNESATTEAGESAKTGNKSLWWTYRPASDGRLTLTTDGSDTFEKRSMVFLGSTLSGLREVAYRYSNNNTSFSFPVTAGVDYHIAIGSDDAQGGCIVLTLTLDSAADVTDLNIPNPATILNDIFAQRVQLTGKEVSAVSYTASATNEISEPAASGERTLWWTYRPPSTGRLIISTQGSDNFDKIVAVYLGSSLTGLKLVSQYETSGGGVVTFSLPVTAGTDYQVSLGNDYTRNAGDAAVISFSLDDDTDVSDLNIGAPASVMNDLFASSTTLSGAVVSGMGYNTGAVREALEPTATKERTLWWSWTAPSTGLAMVDTTGSDAIQKWVSVWTGSSLSGLNPVALSSRSLTPGVLFPITQGETYRIAVGNDSSSSLTNGSVIMSIVSASASPVLVTPLASRFIPVGQPLVLNATAGGLGLSWQWKKGTTILSNTTPTLTDVFPELSDAGTYTVTVAGPGGNTVSTANIGIINTAAQGVTVHEGQDLHIEVQAQGPGLGYQWFRDGIALTANDRITGVSASELSITGMTALDAGDYHCVVSMPDAVNPNNRITMSSGIFSVSGNYRPVAFGGPYVWQVGRNVTDLLGKRFGPTSFKITGLPAGVAYSTATGQLSGNPTAAGTGFFKVIASRDGVAGPERSIAFTVLALDADALGTFNGLVTRSGTFLDAKYGGSINVVTTASGGFSGTLKLGTASYTLKNRFLDNGAGTATSSFALTRKDKTTFTLNLQIALDDGHLTGTLVDGGTTTTVEAWRSVWTKTAGPGLLATTYTAALMPPDAPDGETVNYPRGDGVSFISISSLGVVTWKGTLADGTAITASTTMGPDGQIPLFIMLYTATAPGSITGWTTAVKQQATDPQLDGTAHWSKSQQTTGSMAYKSGFTAHDLTVGGSSFVKPAVNAIILGMGNAPANALLSFGQGGLSQQVGTSLQISSANKPILTGSTLPKLVMTLNVTSATNLGLITGSFELAEAAPSKVKRTVKFTGAAVNRLGAGVGHFLLPQLPLTSTSPVLSGWMELEPAE